MKYLNRMMIVTAVVCCMWGCYPPQEQYPYTRLIQARRNTLQEHLLELLPEEQRRQGAAREEAKWLADTAYKAAAGISRVNDSRFPGWFGNALINSRFQDRGLCWHYQHDMYRELRRRPLEYFRLGCCVRDKANRTEHNCVYVAAKEAQWPHVWVLDAWRWNGRLRVSNGEELDPDDWEDLPEVTDYLSQFYVEGHRWPIEHWFVIRGEDGLYARFNTPGIEKSRQFKQMNENIARGSHEHPGKTTNY